VLFAAIDIGSNTTRVLVAEPVDGQLRRVMEQRAYTRLGRATRISGEIGPKKAAELAEVVSTQVRLAEEVGAETVRIVATAAIREAANRDQVVAEISHACGLPVEVLSDHEEGRLAFLGATKALGYAAEGPIGVVDVGGGSTEIVLGTVRGGVEKVLSFRIGSGSLADDFLSSDPPSASEIRAVREHIASLFDGIEIGHPSQAVAVGGSATSLRMLVGTMLEYETLERAVRVLTGAPIAVTSQRYELDPRRVRILPSGVLLLEKISDLLGCPLQIGKGGLRDGVILDLLNGAAERGPVAKLAG
jgi:exopolyphosphatase/guanosine-5'-triphosphate,3'-diphosphate pyrophosphatase